MLLVRENRVNPLQYKGSYARALGVARFMPSNYRRHAVDYDGDGKRDLWNEADAIMSVANCHALAVNGLAQELVRARPRPRTSQ